MFVCLWSGARGVKKGGGAKVGEVEGVGRVLKRMVWFAVVECVRRLDGPGRWGL